MNQHTTPTEKTRCRYCEKELHGRAGKIFCNVDCKNNFNSRIRSVKRAEENKLFPDVLKAIKNNYRILLDYDLKPGDIGESMVKKTELKRQGFDQRFCTGAVVENNRLWKCCFTFCWHEDENYLYLKCDPYLNNSSKY